MKKEASKGVLGFGIERTEHGRRGRRWLQGMKVFRGVPARAGPVSTKHHPIQSFFWGDYTTRYGHEYTYRIVAMRGTPGALRPAETVSVRISTEKEDEGNHAVYFNRGVAGSQAYVRRFRNKKPSDVPDRMAYRWLSRGLFRGMLNFVYRAKNKHWGLRAAAYECQQGAVLEAFKRVSERGADVKVIFDGRVKKNGPADRNRRAIKEAGIDALAIARSESRSAISHNKFIVLLYRGKPVEVWTGSTNFTDGGIFGHSNCGHVVRDTSVAQAYFEYWLELAKDPKMKDIRPWTGNSFPNSEVASIEGHELPSSARALISTCRNGTPPGWTRLARRYF